VVVILVAILLIFKANGRGRGEVLRYRGRDFRSGDDVYVGQQELLRYQADGAALAIDNLRDRLPDCERVKIQGNPEYVSELTVVQADFAGDESLLIRDVHTTPDETITRHHVVVRQDDLYAYVLLVVESEDRAREIAIAVAERVCEATSGC
jgi:hypothetical protein